jgi:cation:H+ antiporter
VRIVDSVSIILKVSHFWAGLVLLSVGTTLPEIFGGMFSDKKFTALLAIEKLLGAVVVNSTLVIGILAILSPVMVKETLSSGLAGLFTIITLGLFWLFSRSKRKLNRWEGAVLLGIYLMFAGLQLMTAR